MLKSVSIMNNCVKMNQLTNNDGKLSKMGSFVQSAVRVYSVHCQSESCNWIWSNSEDKYQNKYQNLPNNFYLWNNLPKLNYLCGRQTSYPEIGSKALDGQKISSKKLAGKN